MNDWLKVKTAGLPRWAWIALLGGGLAVGLYLRSRSTEETEPEEAEEEVPEGSLSAYEGTDTGAGLAAAGLVGPAAGSVTPVEAPFVPQGIVDIIGAQQETINTAIGALGDREPGERVETIREVETEQVPGESNPNAAIVTGGAPANNQRKQQAQRARQQRENKARAKANKEVVRLTNEINKLEANIRNHPKAKQKKQWQAQIKNKKKTRAKWQAKLK